MTLLDSWAAIKMYVSSVIKLPSSKVAKTQLQNNDNPNESDGTMVEQSLYCRCDGFHFREIESPRFLLFLQHFTCFYGHRAQSTEAEQKQSNQPPSLRRRHLRPHVLRLPSRPSRTLLRA